MACKWRVFFFQVSILVIAFTKTVFSLPEGIPSFLASNQKTNKKLMEVSEINNFTCS